jgi:hypothetical protein
MYFRILNEILASFVCIINIVRFEFQIHTLFFLFKPNLFGTCFVTQIVTYKCPTKVNFVKIRSTRKFGEFIRFFPEGVNPFKIHRRLKY